MSFLRNCCILFLISGKPIANHKCIIYLFDGTTKTDTTDSDVFVYEKDLKQEMIKSQLHLHERGSGTTVECISILENDKWRKIATMINEAKNIGVCNSKIFEPKPI